MEIGKSQIIESEKNLYSIDVRWCSRPEQLSIEILKFRQAHQGKPPMFLKVSQLLVEEILQQDMANENFKRRILNKDFGDLTYEEIPLLVHKLE